MSNGGKIDFSSIGGQPVAAPAIDFSSIGGTAPGTQQLSPADQALARVGIKLSGKGGPGALPPVPLELQQPSAPSPSPAPPWYAPGSEAGIGSRIVEFLKPGAAMVAAPIAHPLQTIQGLGQGTVVGGMTSSGYPAFAPTSNTSVDAANEQVRQQAQQQAVEQGREMVTKHPAYLAGSLIIPPLVGMGAARAVESVMPGMRTAPSSPLSDAIYSTQGDKLATVLKPVSGLDMPQVAASTIPALRESAADLGVDPASFESGAGREGSLLFNKVVQNAIGIHEDRANQVLAPIIKSPTPPRLLANSPDLAAYLDTDEPVTNDMVNQARKDANNVLTRGNYYLKPRSKQLAASDVQIDAKNVANQARDILYTQAQDATGIDLRPLRSSEANLINLGDSSQATHNALSLKQAGFETTGIPTKAFGAARAVVAAKASPLSALASTETPTFLSPMRKFNNAMSAVFEGVTPSSADRTMGGVRAPGMVSMFTSPRALPENVPGYNTSVPGSTPFAPPGYQLGPAPSPTFPQTEIQGQPFIPRANPPKALPPASSIQVGGTTPRLSLREQLQAAGRRR